MKQGQSHKGPLQGFFSFKTFLPSPCQLLDGLGGWLLCTRRAISRFMESLIVPHHSWHCSWAALNKQVNQACEKLIFCCFDSVIVSNNKAKQLLQRVFYLESVWILILWLLCGLWFCEMVTSHFLNDRQMEFPASFIDSNADNITQDT